MNEYKIICYDCWQYSCETGKIIKDNMKLWLDKNIHNDYYISSFSLSEDAIFHFDDEQDAILFKMTWC
jgi:hypothetical protein